MKAKRLVFIMVCIVVLLVSIGVAAADQCGFGKFRVDDPYKLKDYTICSVTAMDGGCFSDQYGYSAFLISTSSDYDAQNYSYGYPVKWTLKKGNWDSLKTLRLYWGQDHVADSKVKVWSLKGGVKVYCAYGGQREDKYYCGMVDAK